MEEKADTSLNLDATELDAPNNNDTGRTSSILERFSFELKIGLYLFILAVFIVLLFGIIGGVSFGQILLNMLLGGIIFYAVGFLFGWVIKKFVPELAEYIDPSSQSPSNSTDESSPSANQIDYLVDDDDDDEISPIDEPISDAKKNEPEKNQSSSHNYIPKGTGKHDEVQTIASEDPERVAKALKTWIHEDE